MLHDRAVGGRVPRVLVERVAVDPALWRYTAWIQLQVSLQIPSTLYARSTRCESSTLHAPYQFAQCIVAMQHVQSAIYEPALLASFWPFKIH